MATKLLTRLLIGAFAEKTSHSIHTIRWYEAQGLLPKVPRDAGGRRVYSQRHVSWMELMDRLRLSGMSVAQLKDFTALAQQGNATLEPTRQVLQAHKAVVEEKITDWQLALTLIEQKIHFYTQWIDTGQRPLSKQHRKI
jgi:DNA-binding transcriptional MerR regulator